MFRQAGLFEYWRDMVRSSEAIQQMSHHPGVLRAFGADVLPPQPLTPLQRADTAHADLKLHMADLLTLVQATSRSHRRQGDRPQPWDARGNFLFGKDLPHPRHRGELNLMCAIECDYAKFAEALLSGVLVPFWQHHRCSLVDANRRPPALSRQQQEAEAVLAEVEAADPLPSDDPHPIQLAEELLAIRYVSVIRSVLINIRQLMAFVSAAFVLAILAWNSYPFQPRQWIDWTFTGLLILLGTAVVWVFAHMHRDPILSGITGTAANELGSGFYLRLATFGAVPILTWIASQFPAVGGSISRLLQSGLEAPK